MPTGTLGQGFLAVAGVLERPVVYNSRISHGDGDEARTPCQTHPLPFPPATQNKVITFHGQDDVGMKSRARLKKFAALVVRTRLMRELMSTHGRGPV